MQDGTRQEQPRELFRSVQYLRAVAAGMVLLYHVGYAFSFLSDGADRPHWLSAGVDIFFLISGFVMVVSTESRPISGGRFLKERLARIVPLYWLVTVLFIAIMAGMGQALPRIEEIATSLLFVFHMNPRTHEPVPIIVAGWTLNYEMLFYLLFAAMIRLSVPMRILAIAALYLGLCAFRPMVSADDAFLFRLTSPQPLEFVAGMALGHFRRHLLALHPLVGMAAFALGLGGLALVDSGLSRVVHFAPCATAIMAGTIICERLFRSDIAPMRLLGDSSYSLYLTHPLVLEPLGVPTGDVVARAVGALATALACVAVAIGFYRAFELPMIRYLRRHLKGRPALAAV